MNVPSTVLVIVVVAAVANVLILLAVVARARADRTRRLADVEGFMSSSYNEHASSEAAPEPGERGLAAAEGWPTSGRAWPDGSDWPTPGWPASDAVRTLRGSPAGPAGPAEATEDAAEPFEYPAPSSLEQRSASLESDGEDAGDEAEFDDHDHTADEDDEDDMDDADDTMDGSDELPEPAAIVGDEADAEAEPDGAATAVMNAGVEPEPEAPAAGPTAPTLGAMASSRTVSVPRGRDPLTGLLDAIAFEDLLAHEDAREQRYGRPATVIVFELDGLAKLVDRLGPQPGDRIETALGDSIQRLARRADRVARLERGRYAVLLPETDDVAAINYVERIRRACDLWLESGAIAMRLAIGWASTGGDAGLSGAVRLATERMRLELRRNGRGADDEATESEDLAVNGHEPIEVAPKR